MDSEQTGRPLTFGEKAVGLNFNPSKDSRVDRIKKLYAEIIDEANNLRNETDSGEVKDYALLLSPRHKARKCGL